MAIYRLSPGAPPVASAFGAFGRNTYPQGVSARPQGQPAKSPVMTALNGLAQKFGMAGAAPAAGTVVPMAGLGLSLLVVPRKPSVGGLNPMAASGAPMDPRGLPGAPVAHRAPTRTGPPGAKT